MVVIMPIFNRGYILRLTTKHCRKAIDLSIRKTFARMREFEDGSEKSKEIFETLAMLHGLRNTLDDFQKLNSDKFK